MEYPTWNRRVKPATVRLVVLARYVQTSEEQLDSCPKSEGALQLASHAMSGADRPSQALRSTATVSRNAQFFAGARGEARAVAEELIQILRREAERAILEYIPETSLRTSL
jgi:hypothetical protein